VLSVGPQLDPLLQGKREIGSPGSTDKGEQANVKIGEARGTVTRWRRQFDAVARV